jgi:type IX secretion system PorP/SprF family membrane protein
MKTFLLVVLTLLVLELKAQYLPNSAQTFQFAPIVNPGFSGIENFNDLKLSYRYQWAGFGGYSPKFINLSYNTRLKDPVDLSYNSIRISDPSMIRVPRWKRSIHGLAGHIFQSKVGIIESIGGGITYAFHYPVVRSWKLSLSGGMFLENRKLDIAEVTVRNPDSDTYYNHLLNSSTTQTDLNLRAGLLLYSKDFYFGFTYLPLINTAIQASDLAFDDVFYRASFQVGKSIQVNPNLDIKPSLYTYLLANGSMVVDGQVKGYIQDKVWAGLGYRSIKSGMAMIGFNFNPMFNAAYTYEVLFGDFQQFGGSSHELVLGVRFNNFKKNNQFTW